MHAGEGHLDMDGAVVELRDALEAQARELEGVGCRLRNASTLLPPRSDDGWHGVAQFFYSLALTGLTQQLEIAQHDVDSAAHQTRRAVGSLGSRVG